MMFEGRIPQDFSFACSQFSVQEALAHWLHVVILDFKSFWRNVALSLVGREFWHINVLSLPSENFHKNLRELISKIIAENM